MTTIAYRDGVMAADSAVIAGGTHHHDGRKLWRVGGGLVGMSGTYASMPFFVRWLQEGADPAEYPFGDYDAIVVDPRGRVSVFEGASSTPFEANQAYVAIGSGATIALGALAAGAGARAAVRAAIRHDTNTKPPVRWLKLRGL